MIRNLSDWLTKPVAEHPVRWGAFLGTGNDAYLDTVMAKCWVIAIMCRYLEGTVVPTYTPFQDVTYQFLGQVTVEQGGLPADFWDYLLSLPYSELTDYALLVSYSGRKKECVCTIWISGGSVEIFCPFPLVWKQTPDMRKSMCRIIDRIGREWMRIKDFRRACTKDSPTGPVSIYGLAKTFPESNVWNLFFQLMRMTQSASQVQAVLADGPDHKQAIQVFRGCGRLISELMKASDWPRYNQFLAANSKNLLFRNSINMVPVFTEAGQEDELDQGQYSVLGLAVDAVPRNGRVAWTTKQLEDSRTQRFAELPNALQPWFIFNQMPYGTECEIKEEKEKGEEKEEEFFLS